MEELSNPYEMLQYHNHETSTTPTSHRIYKQVMRTNKILSGKGGGGSAPNILNYKLADHIRAGEVGYPVTFLSQGRVIPNHLF